MAESVTLSSDSIEALAKALKGTRSGLGGGGGGAPASDFSATKSFTDALKEGGSGVVSWTQETTKLFQKLAASGSNFSNDIIGIGTSAAGTRTELRDFAEIVKQNGSNLSGLGGSVTRGSEAFAKLSKGFFDARLGDDLQQLGFTTRDINDVLALQLGIQKASFKDTQEGRRVQFDAARNLAKEMDLIAKLTGKSREEQEEKMRQAATDAQIEAKFKLIAIEKGEAAAAVARKNYLEQYNKAEAMGLGQVAKETFLRNSVTSDKAIEQVAMGGRGAAEVMRSMQALSRGNEAEARARMDSATTLTAQMANDPTRLRMVTLGDTAGSLGTTAVEMQQSTMTMTTSIEKVAKANGILLTSQEGYKKALDLIRQDIERSRQGVSATGRQVSGATQAVIGTQIAGQEASAAIAQAVQRGVGGDRENAVATSINNAGLEVAAALRKVTEDVTTSFKAGEGLAADIGRAFQNLTDISAKSITIAGEVFAGKRAAGGPVDAGKTYLVGEEGPELVVPKENSTVVPNSGLDLNKVKGDVKTTFSSTQTSTTTTSGGGSTTTRRVQSDDSKLAEQELQKIRELHRADLKLRAEEIKESLPLEQQKGKAFFDAMKKDEEYTKLKETHAAKEEELRKRISAGISYEIEKKQSAVEEEKKITETKEQLSVKQITSSKKELDAETAKAAKLASSVVGTNVENMTDDQIDALIPKGAESDDFYIDIKGRLQSFANDYAQEFKKLSDESAPVIKKHAEEVSTRLEQVKTQVKSTFNASATTGEAVPSTTSIGPVDLSAAERILGIGQNVKGQQQAMAKTVGKTSSSSAQTPNADANSVPVAGAKTEKQAVGETVSASKSATLDDVVRSLEMLNKQMGMLISQSDDLMRRQISATTSNSKNVFDRPG